MNGSIGWIGLTSSLTLVAFAAGISLWQKLTLERQILSAAARALIQLLLVGGLLSVMFGPGQSIWWSVVWTVSMVVYAGDVARRRAPEVPRLAPLASVACATSAVLTLGVVFGCDIFPLQPRTLVPIAGMTIGNSMTAIVVVARRLVEELRDKRDEVEARLALSYPSRQAATPYVRSALRSALSPQIETTKATGLIFLPGAMTGLILAGASPVQAVLVQAVVMFLILAASSISTVLVALGLVRRVFADDHRLVLHGRNPSRIAADRHGSQRFLNGSLVLSLWKEHSADNPKGAR